MSFDNEIELGCASFPNALTVGEMIEVLKQFPKHLQVRLCVFDEQSHPVYKFIRDKFGTKNEHQDVVFVCSNDASPWVPDASEICPQDNLRKIDAPVHYGIYSDGKHIQLHCDQSWIEPKWGSPDQQETEDPEVYIADDDRLYTFEKSKVSCDGCNNHVSINRV